MAPELHCVEPTIGKLLPQYELDLLPAGGKYDFEEHLLHCEYCRVELMSMTPVLVALDSRRSDVLAALRQDGLTFDAVRAELTGESDPQPLPRRTFEDRSIFSKLMDWLRQPVVWGPATALALAVVVLVTLNPGANRSPYEPLLAFNLQPYGGPHLRGAGDEAEREFNQGIAAYETGDLNQAIPHLTKAAALNPRLADAYLYLGISQYVKKDAAAAVRALQQATGLTAGEDLAHAQWYLAQSHLLAGDRVNAEPLLKTLQAAAGPHSPEAGALLEKLRSMK